jgi:monoamine oxidase
MHYCNICNFLTSTNHNLQNHYKSKKHILQQNIVNNNNNICTYCNRSYKYQNSFYKHQQICKKNNTQHNTQQNDIKSLKIALDQINKDLEIANLKNELKDKIIKIKELENKNLQLQINNNLKNQILSQSDIMT